MATHTNVSRPVVLGTPQLVSPVLSGGEGHLPWPAGDALPNPAWEAGGHLCCKGTFASSCSSWYSLGPQRSFSAKLFGPLPMLVPGVIPPQVQDFAFPFVELPEIPV